MQDLEDGRKGVNGYHWPLYRIELLHTHGQSNSSHSHIYKCIFPWYPFFQGPGSQVKLGLCTMLHPRGKGDLCRVCWWHCFQGYLRQIVSNQRISQGQHEWLSPLCSLSPKNIPKCAESSIAKKGRVWYDFPPLEQRQQGVVLHECPWLLWAQGLFV